MEIAYLEVLFGREVEKGMVFGQGFMQKHMNIDANMKSYNKYRNLKDLRIIRRVARNVFSYKELEGSEFSRNSSVNGFHKVDIALSTYLQDYSFSWGMSREGFGYWFNIYKQCCIS